MSLYTLKIIVANTIYALIKLYIDVLKSIILLSECQN